MKKRKKPEWKHARPVDPLTRSFTITLIAIFIIGIFVSISDGYEIDLNGNYVLSKAEMLSLTRQNELKNLEIENLQKKLAVFEDSDLETAIKQTMAGYEEMIDMKDLQIATLTELNSTLTEQNRSLEAELIKYKIKGTAYQTSSNIGWLAAFGLAIAWAVDSN